MFNNNSLLGSMENATMNISTPEPTTGTAAAIVEPLFMRVIRLATYIIIFLIAVFGNSLVIFVVYKTKELHTVTGYLIANLAIADLGVGLLCIPFTVIFFELKFIWPFGFVWCKLLSPLQVFFLMGSVATLMAISVDRHQSIVYPFNPRISLTQGKLIIALIWLIALLPALPMLGVTTIKPHHSYPSTEVTCDEDWPDRDPISGESKLSQIYTVSSFLLTYAVPLPLIITLYIRIGLKLREAIADAADRPGFQAAQMTKKIIKMLVAVVVCYALCYLPYHTTYFTIQTYLTNNIPPIVSLLLSYCQVLMYFNSASNPILYAFLGDQFKAGFKKILGIKSKSPVSKTLQTEYVDMKNS